VGHARLDDHQVLESELLLLLNPDVELFPEFLKSLLLLLNEALLGLAQFVLLFQEKLHRVWILGLQSLLCKSR
jgi:hypothetical protein